MNDEANNDDKVAALHSTTDAQVWTDEFIKTFQKEFPRIEEAFICFNDFKEWVFGWFCNAIQTGIDLTNNKRDKQYVYILQCNSGAIVKVWSHGCEPNERDMDVAYSVFNNLYDTVKGIAAINCTLYRWNRYEGLQSWNGKLTAGTKYNWK